MTTTIDVKYIEEYVSSFHRLEEVEEREEECSRECYHMPRVLVMSLAG